MNGKRNRCSVRITALTPPEITSSARMARKSFQWSRIARFTSPAPSSDPRPPQVLVVEQPARAHEAELCLVAGPPGDRVDQARGGVHVGDLQARPVGLDVG